LQNRGEGSDRRGGPWFRALVSSSGLIGACGVGLGAAGAHVGGGELARTASTFLLLHAAAIVALAALAIRSAFSRTLMIAATVLAFGVAGFSADLAWLAFGGGHVLPGLAPIGGTLMILGWIVVAVSPWLRSTGTPRP
jgi:uncharacterized membrane protein YgdD (TMEM256/DUF423 family)